MGVSIKREGEYVEVEGKGIEGLSELRFHPRCRKFRNDYSFNAWDSAGVPFHTSLIGDESIAKRPMSRVTVPLRSMGAKIDGREHGQYTPLSTRGGALKAIHYHSPVAVHK